MELENDEIAREIHLLRITLAEKIKYLFKFRDIENLKEKIVRHNITDKHNYNEEQSQQQSYEESYHSLKKIEHLLRNQIKQKDSAIVALRVKNDELERNNSKIIDQITNAK